MPKLPNRMKQGMENAQLEELCQNTWRELYRFVYYRVQNREEAEDITQETYAKAVAYLKNKDTLITDYGNYLKTIAMNIIRDQWRIKRRRGQELGIEAVDPEVMAISDFSDAADDRALIKEALGKLSLDQQTVIDLRILKGFSSAETAKLMNKKEGTIRVLQFRAIKALTKLLSKK